MQNSQPAMSALDSQLDNPILIFGGVPSCDDIGNRVGLQEFTSKVPQFHKGGLKILKLLIFHVEIETRRLVVGEAVELVVAVEEDPIAEIFLVGVGLEVVVVFFESEPGVTSNFTFLDK